MAIFSLEDRTGSTQVILFPDTFSAYSQYLKNDEPLLINGLAETNDNSSKIIAKDIETLESLREKSIKAIELRLDMETASRKSLEEIRDIFFRYSGECSVFFRISIENEKEWLIAANKHYKISPCNDMLKAIEGITGRLPVCKYD